MISAFENAEEIRADLSPEDQQLLDSSLNQIRDSFEQARGTADRDALKQLGQQIDTGLQQAESVIEQNREAEMEL